MTRTQLHAGGLADELAPLVVVVVRQQVLERHVEVVRVAVPGLPVGEGELARFGDEVDVLGAARFHGRHVVAAEQGELLEEDRSLAPGAGLADGQPLIVVTGRGFEAGVPGGQVVAGEQAPVAFSGHVHDGGSGELADLLRDEAVVPGAPRGLKLGVAVVAGCLRLVEDPLVGGGEGAVREQGARRRHPAVRQVHLGGGVPVLAEQVRHAGDRPADRRHERVTGLGVADRVAEDVAQPEGAVLAQQEQPAAERAGHGSGEQAAAGYQVKSEVRVRVGGRGGRGGALPADHERLAAPGVVADHRHLAARAVEVRLDDLEGEPGGDRGVERVAAPLKHGHADRRGQPVGGRHHPEGPGQLRPRRELRDVRHVRHSSVFSCPHHPTTRGSRRPALRASCCYPSGAPA